MRKILFVSFCGFFMAYFVLLHIVCYNLYNWSKRDSIERFMWDFSMTGQCVKYLRESGCGDPRCEQYADVLGKVVWEGVLLAYNKGILDSIIDDMEKNRSWDGKYVDDRSDSTSEAKEYVIALRSIRQHIADCKDNESAGNRFPRLDVLPPEGWKPESLIYCAPALKVDFH